MSSENVLCRAEIKPKYRSKKILTIVLLVFLAIGVGFVFLGANEDFLWNDYMKDKNDNTVEFRESSIEIYGETFIVLMEWNYERDHHSESLNGREAEEIIYPYYSYHSDYRSDFRRRGVSRIEKNNDIIENEWRTDFYLDGKGIAMALVWIIPILLIPLIVALVLKLISKKNTICLTSDNVQLIGKKSGVFGSKEINISMDKLESISINSSVLNKIYGGETIVIRSTSETVKFPWVKNAKEFVDMTLAELNKYKESVSNKSAQQTVVNNSSDEADKLMKLKKLLEQGLITQEEFEQKRQELISRM